MTRSEQCLARVRWTTLILGIFLLVAASTARGELIYGITFDNQLFSFDSEHPEVILSAVYVQGEITARFINESIQVIDFRPSTGELFAVSTRGSLYTIDEFSIAASVNNSSTTVPGTAWGMDFNPVTDKIHMHSNINRNIFLEPDGTGGESHLALSYAAGDPGEGLDPNVVATAYSDDDTDPETGTTLYSIDSVRDTLNRHSGPPGYSQMVTVGSLGVPFEDYAGFDISPTGTAFVSWGNAGSMFGTVDLSTGAVTSRGTIGGGMFVRDIAVAATAPEPAPLGLLGAAGIGLLLRSHRFRLRPAA